MNEVVDVSKTVTDNKEYSTPGAQLKKARGKAGYSVEDLAKELYLSVSKVHALEEDRYEDLPSTVFAQGYIRKYAKAVGLPDNELVDCFNEYLAQMRETVDPITQIEEPPARSIIPPKWVMPVGVFGAAVLVLAVVFVVTGEDESDESALKSAVTFEPEASVQSEDFNRQDLNSQERDAATNVNPDENDPVENTEEVDAQPQPSTDQSSALENEMAIQSAIEVEAHSLAVMAFSFTDECWLEVTDASGKIVIARVVSGGESINLSGEAPLQVVLGKARAVSIKFNGETVEVPVVQGRQTTKFVLGD